MTYYSSPCKPLGLCQFQIKSKSWHRYLDQQTCTNSGIVLHAWFISLYQNSIIHTHEWNLRGLIIKKSCPQSRNVLSKCTKHEIMQHTQDAPCSEPQLFISNRGEDYNVPLLLSSLHPLPATHCQPFSVPGPRCPWQMAEWAAGISLLAPQTSVIITKC